MEVLEASPLLDDASPRVDALCVCEIRRWTAGVVVASNAYSSNIPMRLRAGAFAVLELHFDEVVSVAVRASTPLARPELQVSSFSRRFLPRVVVGPELEHAIEATCFEAAEED